MYTLRIPSIDSGETETIYQNIPSLKDVKKILKREIGDEPGVVAHLLIHWDPTEPDIHFDLTDEYGAVCQLKWQIAFKIGKRYITWNHSDQLIWRKSGKVISDEEFPEKIEPLLVDNEGSTPMSIDLSNC